MVEPVEGRSYVRAESALARTKALKSGGRAAAAGSAPLPNEVELRLAYLARVLGAASAEKRAACSDEKASQGNRSVAYGGGPGGTP